MQAQTNPSTNWRQRRQILLVQIQRGNYFKLHAVIEVKINPLRIILFVLIYPSRIYTVHFHVSCSVANSDYRTFDAL